MFALCAKRYANHFGGCRVRDAPARPEDGRARPCWPSQTRKGRPQLRFAGIPIPKEVENTQFFVGGSTGTGKSVCISDYIESAVARA